MWEVSDWSSFILEVGISERILFQTLYAVRDRRKYRREKINNDTCTSHLLTVPRSATPEDAGKFIVLYASRSRPSSTSDSEILDGGSKGVDAMAARFLWRAQTKLLFGATAVGGGAAAAAIANSDDPATALKLCTLVPLRLFRDSVTAATIAFGTLYAFVFSLIAE